MGLLKRYLFIMRKKEPGAFRMLLIVMLLAPFVLNFSYAAYRNYQNAKLAKYLDLNNFTVQLNESITKGQLNKCLMQFSDELEDSISGWILDVELTEGTVCCRFSFRNGLYGRDGGYQNLLQNNFVTTYFTEEQEQNGELVALAPGEGDIYSWAQQQDAGASVSLQGKTYRIIGFQSWDSFYMIPYASLDDSTVIGKDEGIAIYFKEAVTETQYEEICDIMSRTLGDSVTVPVMEFTDMQKDGLNRVMSVIVALLAAVFCGNICILVGYIREKLQRERSIYYICGMTGKRMCAVELGSILILSIPGYVLGNILYDLVVGRNIHMWLEHLSASMLTGSYPQVFGIYLSLLILFLGFRAGRAMRMERRMGRA